MAIQLISKVTVLLLMFLFGLQCMKIGLFQLSYHRTKKWVYHFSKNPLISIGTGFMTTCLLQSSSVVIVLAMGLVTTKHMKVSQAIGIMLGANLGTTLTGEILSLSLDIPYLFFLVIGVLLILIKNQKSFAWGTIIFGIAVIFLALENFGGMVNELTNWKGAAVWLAYMDGSAIAAFGFGVLGTGFIHSSSAMFGITITLLQQELISMSSAIAIILGANIGTCITATIAGAALDKEARIVASSHFWYNVIGVAIVLPFIDFMADISTLLANEPAQQLAHFAVLFNTFTLALFYPFIHQFETFLKKMFDRKP
ncbi:Na/Pi symporter [Thalassobacillus pellis]|uniref:Na/Pi symporter n=1 Tax=Thalassobacillus pellis TaxID=748008 RepID=UPI0019607499|nr:Na/Pi symporter [Thalassobacillus pellis]MBM7554720.1 phosphate:Na+ symporter [Thalassobacillus pellis]